MVHLPRDAPQCMRKSVRQSLVCENRDAPSDMIKIFYHSAKFTWVASENRFSMEYFVPLSVKINQDFFYALFMLRHPVEYSFLFFIFVVCFRQCRDVFSAQNTMHFGWEAMPVSDLIIFRASINVPVSFYYCKKTTIFSMSSKKNLGKITRKPFVFNQANK